MGLGTDPAGAGPAGVDLPTTTEERLANTPVALAFDGTKRDFVLDERGRYKSVHPVDSKVFLILRTALGSISSASGVGQGIPNIRYIDSKSIKATCTDLIRTALAALTAAREITIELIEIDTGIRGRIQARVTYVNLVTGLRETAAL